MKVNRVMLVACLLFPPLALADGPVTHETGSREEASEQVSLAAYILQAIAHLSPRTEAENQLQACVSKVTSLAPGGGDAYGQSRSYSQDMPLSVLMQQGLAVAAANSQAANECQKRLTDLPIRFTSQNAQATVGRNGRVLDPVLRKDISSAAGRTLLCARALSTVSKEVASRLDAAPPMSQQDAIQTAGQVIADNLHVATQEAFNLAPGELNGALEVMIKGNNAGASRPYQPVTPGSYFYPGAVAGEDERGKGQVFGATVSSVAAAQSTIGSLIVGGVYAYQTLPDALGFTLDYEGGNLRVTRDGLPFYDGNTIDGEQAKVSMGGSAQYTADAALPGGAARDAALKAMGVCALAINNVAGQMAPKLLRPTHLPAPDSAFAQGELRHTRIAEAFEEAKADLAGNVEQDLSGGGLKWKIGRYQFGRDTNRGAGGVTVTLAGATLFDDQHVNGRTFTVNASTSTGATSNYSGE
ncbi:hypothetical protein PQR68_34545 [Paraburkholderia agricolaris]|uniref:hypothetical protein n=1 Tax=Paraburkholderia agricolaris TaxID=2152888 RepID=UPI0038B7D154